jgi:hypothetical protein
MEDAPATVLRLTLPASTRKALPSGIATQLEEEVQLEGALEILHEDSPGGARYHYGLHVGGVRYSLHFAVETPTHLLSGATIRVRGTKLDRQLALAGNGNSVQTVSAAPASSTIGEQRTLAILVNFQDNATQPWSRDQVSQAIFGTLNDFIRENSYGAASVTGDVTEWMTIAMSSSVCQTSTLASLAEEAAKTAGWVLSNYSHLMFAFPKNACDFAGASTVGGVPSRAWLKGTIAVSTTAHEFGHGLGLWHSHSMDCGDVALGPVCITQEYGDTLDVMGLPFAGHFNAFQKERLGWLTPLTVTASGTYSLGAYESTAEQRALKILRAVDRTTGKRTWFYLETRKSLGFDTALVYSGMTNGVAIRLGSENSGNTSYLLDMSPNSSSIDMLDPALVEGQSFQDPDAGVIITTASVTTGGAAVTVLLQTGTTAPTDPAPTTPPTVTVTTDQPSYTRNQQVSMLATVKSGSSPIAGASVTFTVTDSAGSAIVASATTGSDGTAVYKLRLKRQNPPGLYEVAAAAKKDALAGTADTTFTVR